jgi:hypothetical protein
LSLEEFSEIEQDVFARLREIRGGRTGAISMTSDDSSVNTVEIESPDLK